MMFYNCILSNWFIIGWFVAVDSLDEFTHLDFTQKLDL